MTNAEQTPSGRALGLPHPGEILAGKYCVEAVLGVGGMAVVVAARHIELDHRVALKILLPRYRANEEVVARFRREARAAVKIKSEHVARVHDVGALDDGAPCLVMEFLEGHDLETLLADQGPLPQETAVDYMLEACEALAEAHGLSVVHRDLKPANLFLAQRSDGKPIIKLLDFGISKVGGVELTRRRSSFGTPHYMSPEQLLAAGQVDYRSDIWSMGAILHELIAGRPPFDSEDLSELQQLIKQGAPRRLSEDVPDAPPGLERVILRCLEKDAKKRFENVAELAAALGPFGSAGHAQIMVERVKGVTETAKNRAAVTDSQQHPAIDGGSVGFLPMAGVQPATETLKASSRSATTDRVDAPIGSRMAIASAVALAAVALAGLYGIAHYRSSAPAPSQISPASPVGVTSPPPTTVEPRDATATAPVATMATPPTITSAPLADMAVPTAATAPNIAAVNSSPKMAPKTKPRAKPRASDK
ncbi:protein kinase domain-containing protein [Pendulispora albinea]|uniref:Protein kinase n=1 Tax=Pendulispora albinea TaxID=2741071 RepID=A0ABZ2LQ44_9BACT